MPEAYPIFELPRRNGSRVAAAFIAAQSPPTAGVLADTVAIEFYSGHPVRSVRFTYPKEVVLRSLEGKSGDDISFVVIDAATSQRNFDPFQQQCNHCWRHTSSSWPRKPQACRLTADAAGEGGA